MIDSSCRAVDISSRTSGLLPRQAQCDENKIDKAIKHTTKGLMLATIVILTIVLNAFFAERYAEVISNQVRFISRGIAILIVVWIVLSSFYACYHFVSFSYSIMVKTFGRRIKRCYGHTPPVAILYLCMNDIKEKAILSLLKQNYPDYHLYILDDSTAPEEQQKADNLHATYSKQITVIRRPRRTGFKAGNLNHTIVQIRDAYKYFTVMDADEIAPANFLKETVAIAEADPYIGFVQACHKQYGDTAYGKKTGDGIDLHWNYFLPARNRFGFVYFYGHGALIRMRACTEVGGFPEVVAEDIALAAKMRESGYHGCYADDIICEEEVPPSYGAWRKRNAKVVRGTLEFLTHSFPSFAKSKNVPFTEKLDLLISSSVLFLPALFLCFLVLLHAIMPFFSKDSYSISCIWLGTSNTGYIRTAMGLFKPLWGWDTLAFTIFTIFAPLCYLIPNLIRSPMKVLRYIWRMTAIHLSGTINVFCETLGWFLTRRVKFDATANDSGSYEKSLGIYIEGICGLMIFLCSIFTGSLCLMAVGLSIALVPLLIRNNLTSRLCATLVLLPMALTLFTFCVVPLNMLGITGVFVGVGLAHH